MLWSNFYLPSCAVSLGGYVASFVHSRFTYEFHQSSVPAVTEHALTIIALQQDDDFGEFAQGCRFLQDEQPKGTFVLSAMGIGIGFLL
jgi:hypothetical protein